ncbi:hypothetical protein GCM10011391_28400 [Pullulanibacillus camelliae]|uniref:YopX protein domain-containing protein n=1 Tax=Pullulanibacillus camelliae TaxID=1707096 RepID=A0A8J3DVK8_9BACL|nr:YopX family protein [Pullulanibacillus camelliae]GGE47948.1 hypothetical protein GCM10011391_28400 [Pullulanibacillus camelliae]
MREIKFRAWDRNEKNMVKVTGIIFSAVQHTLVRYRYVNDKGKTIDEQSHIDEEGFGSVVLMQYTGLKDKNDKEIYEGDIVVLYNTQEGNVSGRVYWDELLGRYLVFRDEDKLYDLYEFLSEEMNIIGNIYENPELLKGDAP